MKNNIYNKKKLNLKRVIFTFAIIIIIIVIIISFNNNKFTKNKKNNILEIMEDAFGGVTENSAFPEDVYGIKVITKLINEGTDKRTGEKRKIKYIVIHETDNEKKGANAKNHAEYQLNNNESSTSWHYTVDSKEIYHHIPDNEIANHAGTYEGNKYGIGIELCVNEDGDFEKTFDNAAKLVAFLLKEYNLDLEDIKLHHDFSGKDCPHIIINNNRVEEFIEKVEKYSRNII